MSLENVLLVGGTEKGRELLLALTPPEERGISRLCQSGSEARRMMGNASWELAVINTPLGDESGLELAMELASQTLAGVLLLVKAELADTVAQRVEASGVMVVPKPVSRGLYDQARRFALVASNRLTALRRENERLEQKLAEQRIVNRAKCMLMETRGMTEQQAHRHLEKQAMDTRQTKLAIARSILAALEL